MSEGPQVLRRTEWLHRYLAGRNVIRCDSNREDIPAGELNGRQVERVFCKGKNIFIEFEGGQFLHNHLLMRGKWKKLEGQLLLLPEGAWLGLYVGPYTICNLSGQKLKLVGPEEVKEQLASLGPDAMSEPYPATEIRRALLTCTMAISEALLAQSVLAGVGNIAKSEILFLARLDPRIPSTELNEQEMDRLLEATRSVLRDSYNGGGRWKCRVYHRYGDQCDECRTAIRSLSLSPSKRATYFCPKCQRRNA